MTLLDLPKSEDRERDALVRGDHAAEAEPKPTGPGERAGVNPADIGRPLLAAGLSSSAAGLVIGGMFGSISARVIGLLAAAVGPAWAFVSYRSRNRPLTQLALLPVLIATGAVTLVVAGESPAGFGRLVNEAIASGRNFRPPVPFDPGWRPLIVMVVGLVGFAAATIAVTTKRPRLAVVIPAPLAALAAVSQPENATFTAGLSALLPILAAVAVVFGDSDAERRVSRDFELKRLARGAVATAALCGVLLAVNSASFLFPSPVYNPNDRPQKPRAVPLADTQDRVLFEVLTGAEVTGPWRIGALDVYADGAFQSVPSTARLQPLSTSGALDSTRAAATSRAVQITVRDLGDAQALPTPPGATQVSFDRPFDAKVDPRYQTLRTGSGRVPGGLVYRLQVPAYASADELSTATPGSGDKFKETLAAPPPPSVVEGLLASAPPNPWARLDLLRQTLLDRAVAAGAGTPVAVSAQRVAEILAQPQPEGANGIRGNRASPYEIVASEALLARWAGIPSRIGFGYDGLNTEGDLLTVRPRNAAQWLEVYFENFGWVPLIGQPNQAQASLDPANTANFKPNVVASTEVAVQVYVVYERRDARMLYERLRRQLLRAAPWAAMVLGAYVAAPGAAKLLRTRRRRRWAAARGPRAQIAVEYAELRDLAIDLNVGDDYDSPLEYLRKVVPDEEHEELAWLAARVVYGDLAETVTDDDVLVAEELARSLRRRIARAQPASVQALAFISRASIDLPFTTEIPNTRVIRIGPYLRAARARVSRVVAGAVRRGSSITPRLRLVIRGRRHKRVLPSGGAYR